jgi:hypothetical protein
VPQEFWSNAIFSLTPTVVVGLIFWFVLRAIIRADRTEREARAKIEAEERSKLEQSRSDSATLVAREPEVSREV